MKTVSRPFSARGIGRHASAYVVCDELTNPCSDVTYDCQRDAKARKKEPAISGVIGEKCSQCSQSIDESGRKNAN